MTLSEWINSAGDLSREQITDVLAQLLAFCPDRGGKLSAADFSVISFENKEYFDIIPSGNFSAYESGLEPPSYDDGDIAKGNAYVCGLLLYKLLKGALPADYDTLVQRCAVAAGGGGAAPVLTVPESPFGGLLAALTEISCERRADAFTALDMLASARPGCAVVRIAEEETGVQIGRAVLDLNTAFTSWKPLDEYRYDEQLFYPADASERSFPYRAFAMEYVCGVRAARYSLPQQTSCAPAKGTVCVGIDLGAVSSEISLLDENGLLFEKNAGGHIAIPSIAALTESGTLVFGNEARALCGGSRAEPIRCFACDDVQEPDYPVSYTAADGSRKAVSLRYAAGEYMRHIRRLTEEAAGGEKAVIAGFLLPPDTEKVKWREVIGGAVKGFGWDIYYPDHVCAAAEHFSEMYKTDEQAVIFDIGESALRAGISSSGAFSDIGGEQVTRLIAEKLMRDLLSDDIDLYGEENGRFDPAQIMRGRRAVFETSENIKKRLSFDSSASCALTLELRGGTNTRLVSMTREELEDITAPVRERITKAVTGILRGVNLDSADIRHILITGGGSLIPSVSAHIKSLFPSAKAHFPHDVVFLPRGAALYVCSKRFRKKTAASETVPMDYGIQKINTADNRLRFVCLLKAGTEFSVEESARIIYRLEAAENDTDGESFIMKLYTRPKGMEHVISTLSPENAIKYIGRAEAKIPSGYDKNKDAVDFIITVHADGAVTAEAEHMRRPNALSKLKKRQTRDGMDMIGTLTAVFAEA